MGVFLICICTYFQAYSGIQPCTYLLGVHLCLGVDGCLVYG